MNTIDMAKYGSTLTDRADGKRAVRDIEAGVMSPVALDFRNVISLGSSFGDEVIPKLAEKQDNQLTIINTNSVIKNSIRRIVEETEIEISFTDGSRA